MQQRICNFIFLILLQVICSSGITFASGLSGDDVAPPEQQQNSTRPTLADQNGFRPANPNNAIKSLHFRMDKITLVNAYARPSMAGSNNSAAYVSLHNANPLEAVIIAAIGISGPTEGSTSVANRTEMHIVVNDENNMSKMIQVNKLVIPANGDLIMKSGGMHIMLLDLKKPLKDGDKIYVKFIIQGIGPYIVEVPVQRQ